MALGTDGKRRVLFHKRAEVEERTEGRDPLEYEEVPLNLVLRTKQFLKHRLGDWQFMQLAKVLCVETGGHFASDVPKYAIRDVLAFLDSPLRLYLTVIEAATDVGTPYWGGLRGAEEILGELQAIFSEEFFGYRLEWHPEEDAYRMGRFDNEHLQRDIVDRAFELTALPIFGAAQADYAEARKDYSKGDYADAVLKCGRAYESAMKAVLKGLSFEYDQRDTAAKLAKRLIEQGLLPERMEGAFTHLRMIMENSIGTIRNQGGVAHGTTELGVAPDQPLTYLTLNLTGSLIVFIAQQYTLKTT